MIRRLLRRLRATAWDLDIAGYTALLLALAALSGAAGPTLDNIHAQDGRGRTQYAAKE